MSAKVANASRQQDNALKPISSKLMQIAKETFARLEHLQNFDDPNRQDPIVRALNGAIKKIQKTPKELAKAFLDKYEISVNKRKVTFTIPKNSSVIELLTEAQMISFVTRGSVAVYPPRLANWAELPEFTRKSRASCTLTVEPLFPGSEFKSRSEAAAHLKESGHRIATAWEAAAAHAAFTVFQGKPLADLFDGNIIRVKGTKLYYGNGGLSEMYESDFVNSCSYKNVKMAAAKRL